MPMGLQADSRTQPSIDAEHQAIPLVDIGVFGIWVVEVGSKLLAEQKLPQQEFVAHRKACFQGGGIVSLLVEHIARPVVIHKFTSEGVCIESGKLPAPFHFQPW